MRGLAELRLQGHAGEREACVRVGGVRARGRRACEREAGVREGGVRARGRCACEREACVFHGAGGAACRDSASGFHSPAGWGAGWGAGYLWGIYDVGVWGSGGLGAGIVPLVGDGSNKIQPVGPRTETAEQRRRAETASGGVQTRVTGAV